MSFYPCDVNGIDVSFTYSALFLYPGVWRYYTLGSPIARCGPPCALLM
jgi:hypothetical protein